MKSPLRAALRASRDTQRCFDPFWPGLPPQSGAGSQGAGRAVLWFPLPFLVCRREIKRGWGVGQESEETEQEGTLAPLGAGRWGHCPFCILTLS